MVTKIIGYDQTGPQSWMKNVLLVADRNDGTTDFEQNTQSLAGLVPAGYTAQRILRDSFGAPPLGDDPAVTQALKDQVNAGQLIVNYVGHGSDHLWGGASTILENADVASWTAQRTPFVVAMNWPNGPFQGIWDQPGEPRRSDATCAERRAVAVGVFEHDGTQRGALVNRGCSRLFASWHLRDAWRGGRRRRHATRPAPLVDILRRSRRVPPVRLTLDADAGQDRDLAKVSRSRRDMAALSVTAAGGAPSPAVTSVRRGTLPLRSEATRQHTTSARPARQLPFASWNARVSRIQRPRRSSNRRRRPRRPRRHAALDR